MTKLHCSLTSPISPGTEPLRFDVSVCCFDTVADNRNMEHGTAALDCPDGPTDSQRCSPAACSVAHNCGPNPNIKADNHGVRAVPDEQRKRCDPDPIWPVRWYWIHWSYSLRFSIYL